MHPLRASSQGFLDQRLAKPAIDPGHEDYAACDLRQLLHRNLLCLAGSHEMD
jgi:hypothetical protein